MARKKTSEPKKADEMRKGHVVVKTQSKKLLVRDKAEENNIEVVEAEIVSNSGNIRGGVGGNGNLIPFDQRTEEERREICTAGGVASGEARRKKKAMRELLNDFLDQQATPILKANMQKLGVNPDDMTNTMAMLMSLFSKAVNHSDINAFRTLMEYAGRAPLQEMQENAAIAKLSQAMQLAEQNSSGADENEIEDVVFYVPDNGRTVINTDNLVTVSEGSD